MNQFRAENRRRSELVYVHQLRLAALVSHRLPRAAAARLFGYLTTGGASSPGAGMHVVASTDVPDRDLASAIRRSALRPGRDSGLVAWLGVPGSPHGDGGCRRRLALRLQQARG